MFYKCLYIQVWSMCIKKFQPFSPFLCIALFSVVTEYVMYLYISEAQKFIGSLFFGWDKELYCEKIDQPAICNTSDLNEELGQVW
jgi:phospholipid-translocating ATPase